MFASLALIALAIEAAFGYPETLYRRIGHPVTWIGALIAWADRTWNAQPQQPLAGRSKGAVLVLLLMAASVAAGIALMLLPALALPGLLSLLVIALLSSSLIAQRSLYVHVAAVAEGLENRGLEGGRAAVAMIVGRDPASLDEAGVSRAAIESLAENFSDGIVAPTFWLAMAGLPGAILYKAINTADSMIGHRSARHIWFGWAAARTDDLLNLPASRLSGLLIAGAALSQPGPAAASALRSMMRDAGQHRSPNAGWPEAAMAGALGLRLAGPRVYGGQRVDDHWMGDGRAEATHRDIRRALQIYANACALHALLYLAAAVAIGSVSVTMTG